MPFSAIWMDQKIIILGEVIQTNISSLFLFIVWGYFPALFLILFFDLPLF